MNRKLCFFLFLILSSWLAAAAAFGQGPGTSSQSWTDRPFDSAADKFTFAVFSDLTGGERDGVFELAVAQLNLLRPEFIVNVGDLIEGDELRSEIDRQWDSFDARAQKARARLFYVGGNHDLLGVAMREAWEERLGERYYHFVHRDTLFLVLDTEDYPDERLAEIAELRRQAIHVARTRGWDAFAETEYARMPEDETGFISLEQGRAMVSVLEKNPDVRWTFLFMHKAPWAAEKMPGWSAIEAALDDRPYTVFHGHRHGYRYQQRNGRDHIRLATTGGVFLPENGPSMDHVMLVTVAGDAVDIANLKLSGILDKTGRLPRNGEQLCLEAASCPDQ